MYFLLPVRLSYLKRTPVRKRIYRRGVLGIALYASGNRLTFTYSLASMHMPADPLA